MSMKFKFEAFMTALLTISNLVELQDQDNVGLISQSC